MENSEHIEKRIKTAIEKLNGEEYKNLISHAFRYHRKSAEKALAFAERKEPAECRHGRAYNFISHFNFLLERKNVLLRGCQWGKKGKAVV